MPVLGQPIAGAGLARDDGQLVVLVGFGTTIEAFDVVTGAPVGQFSTADLTADGLNRVDGIGSNDTQTFVSDATAGTNGSILQINVTASLASGHAVAVGTAFSPGREFELSGGLSGVAGTNTIYATGAAHFDQFVPDQVEEGILGFLPSRTGTDTEVSRLAINGANGDPIIVGPPGSAKSNPTMALGSVGANLALDTGVTNGENVVALINPSTNAAAGTILLQDGHLLAGLSESFHPELVNGVIIDVSNNLRRFVGTQATGLVLSAGGAVNLVQIGSATDTAVLGRPLNHVNIPRRQNVILQSTARGNLGVGTRGGVTVKAISRAPGPLTLP